MHVKLNKCRCTIIHNIHGIIGKFYEIKQQHVDFSLNIVNKDNIGHPTTWHKF